MALAMLSYSRMEKSGSFCWYCPVSMIFSALTMTAMDLSALLKARLTAKKARAFLPDFCYFIQWISLNNQSQLFAAECGDRVFGFRMPAFNQFDEPLRRLFLMIC
jgi:hypothetical protein